MVSWYVQENMEPKIEILAPTQDKELRENTVIPYALKVSDREDGDSEYNEINSKEVIMTVTYFSDTTGMSKYVKEKLINRTSLLSEIAVSNCFTCHEAKGKLIGPSFEDIAKKYEATNENLKYLAQKINLGSTGVWGNQIMPAQSELGNGKALKILDWIFQNAKDPNFTFYSGIEGVFQTKKKAKNMQKGNYILRAQYADHGINGLLSKSKMGSQTIILPIE